MMNRNDALLLVTLGVALGRLAEKTDQPSAGVMKACIDEANSLMKLATPEQTHCFLAQIIGQIQAAMEDAEP
ncbi:MAG: hypothetical protein KME35_08025 [Aphanocapsa sp. GSE-SYN-MK-11-07L]|jgi:hypothetical protein|nr:hypothetical protein [Aphanocapsa sp. GSE-SYN-MK-11-07L]